MFVIVAFALGLYIYRLEHTYPQMNISYGKRNNSTYIGCEIYTYAFCF